MRKVGGKKIRKRGLQVEYMRFKGCLWSSIKQNITIRMTNFRFHMRNYRIVNGYNIDYHIVENCNLNCVGCLHFSPIAEKEYIPIEKLEKELKILVEKLGSQLKSIKLLGGEPLLHPEIKRAMKVTRETLGNDVDVLLLTNGILLTQMDEEFWNICRKCNIIIGVSEYPIKVNYDMLKELSMQHFVEFITFAYRDEFWKWKILDKKLPLLRKWSNFFWCPLANSCHTYRNERVYTCCVAAHIHHFEKKFYPTGGGYDKETNSISINSRRIGRFLSRPIPMCRYCGIEKNVLFQKWKHSEGKIEEWK